MREEIEKRIEFLRKELTESSRHHGEIWKKIDFLEKLYEALYQDFY